MIKLRKLAVFLIVGLALACGTESDNGLECGEGTVVDEAAQTCVPDARECDDDEVLDSTLGRCVPSGDSYCGEGTILDESIGQCVIESTVTCGDDTVDEQGECVPAQEFSCGEGTVASDGECRPDEVCAEDTEYIPGDDACRPTEDVCGEGTVYDVSIRECIPASTLECGPGTRADQDYICQPTRTFFEDLADAPDLDLSDEGADGSFELPGEGEQFVFVGNIDAPQLVDDEFVQHRDHYHFDAPAGQWLDVTVFSLGLPEPAFTVSETDPEEGGFYRISDLGAGIEVSREILIPRDGSFEMQISNMPQIRGAAPPSGGEDWGYVGIVETLPTPPAQSFDLLNETKAGDIRALSDNVYAVDDAGDIDSLAFIFDTLPDHSDAQLQIWSDEATLDSVIELSSDALTFEPPSDDFLLVLDRIQAFGPDTEYAFSARQGTPLSAGESWTQEVELASGDYVGVFQFNLEGLVQSASIADDGASLASELSLEVSNADDGPTSLYWYSDEAQTVTLELTNTSGQDLDFVAFSHVVGSAESLPGLDGSLIQSHYDTTVARGHRHYYEVGIETEELLALRLEETTGNAALTLYDQDRTVVESSRNALVFEPTPGDYVLSVQALETLNGGFTLSSQSAELFETSGERSTPFVIPDGDEAGITDSLQIETCDHIQDIEVSINISHTWRSDLIVDVISPVGESANIHDRDGGQEDDILASYPEPGDPDLSSGEELLDLIGTNGSGTWELFVRDVVPFEDGILNSWSIELVCLG